jgi:hypothetical protein
LCEAGVIAGQQPTRQAVLFKNEPADEACLYQGARF